MLSQQRNPCTDWKSPNNAQLGAPPTIPQVTPGPCSSVGMRRGTVTYKHTDRHTDARDQYTFRVVYDSRNVTTNPLRVTVCQVLINCSVWHTGASTPYKRWSKCTMEKVGGLQELRGKCINFVYKVKSLLYWHS